MKTINDFIKELQSISEEKRNLPLVISMENGILVEPVIKMLLTSKYPGTDILNSELLESMIITYQS